MAPVNPMLASVGPKPASSMKSVGAWPACGDDLFQPRRERTVDMEAEGDHRGKQQRQEAAEQAVVAGRPDHDRVRNEPVGLVRGDDERAHDAGGEAHVVEAVAHVRLEELCGGRDQDEADGEACADGEGDAKLDGQRRAEQDFREDGGQCSAEERGVDMARKRLPLESREKEDAEDDRPDVEQILAEEAKAQDKEQAGHRRTRDLRLRHVIDDTGAQRQQAGVHAGGADAADPEIIGEQGVARRDNLDQAVQYLRGAIDREAEDNERGGAGTHDAKDRALRERRRECAVAGFFGHRLVCASMSLRMA